MADEYEAISAGGYPMDECMSALQKEIRRGHAKPALYWAIEVNSKWPDALWRRLVVIATEDIGGANPELVNTITCLSIQVPAMRKASSKKDYDLCILGFAILQMARSLKSRESDDIVNEVLRERREGVMVLEVPDYAVDQHTKRGKALGRNALDFWREGARLENEAFPSDYVGWDPQHGDGYHHADGSYAPVYLRREGAYVKTGQSSLFGDEGENMESCPECGAKVGHMVDCSRLRPAGE